MSYIIYERPQQTDTYFVGYLATESDIVGSQNRRESQSEWLPKLRIPNDHHMLSSE